MAAPLHSWNSLTLRTRLEPGEPFFRMQQVDGEPNTETRLEVIERGPQLWRYALHPVTGRKHQLRVHMAALGAGILNDGFYPDLHDTQAPDDHARPCNCWPANWPSSTPSAATPCASKAPCG